jgi:hypothetical protein
VYVMQLGIAIAIQRLWLVHAKVGCLHSAATDQRSAWQRTGAAWTTFKGMSNPSQLRVADADREQLVEELRDHAVAGRLTSEELEERIGAAYEATTRGDLDALRADLPVSSKSVALALRKRKGQLRRRLLQESGGSLGVSGLAVGVWVAVGAHGAFWPAWVIAISMLPVVRDSWRLFGPASDLEAVEARMQARHERRLARGQRVGGRHYRHRYRGLPR